MKTFSELLAFCVENSPVTFEFPAQKPATRSFDVFFDLHLNQQLANNGDTGNLRRHRAHYDVIVIWMGWWHRINRSLEADPVDCDLCSTLGLILSFYSVGNC